MTSLPWRQERLSEDFRREINYAISRKVRDPRIPTMTAATQVKLSPDTRNATIFVSIYGSDIEQEEAIAALNRAAPFIQRETARRIKIKHFPKFLFKLDTSLDNFQHIDNLLDQIKDDLD